MSTEIDRAETALRIWVASRPYGRRWLRCSVMESASGECAVAAMERGDDGHARPIATGFSREGFGAAMIDCARQMEPSLRSAETVRPRSSDAARATIPAPPPTGAVRCYLDALEGRIGGAQ